MIPVICPRCDSDGDGVPDCKDCKPLDKRYQHKKTWKQKMIEEERFKRAHADDIIWQMKRGWSGEQAVSRMIKQSKGKRNVNLDKLTLRHQQALSVPNAVGFAADDIRRTKDVVSYIKEHNLKDVGVSIKL